jgi:hypothetical protein
MALTILDLGGVHLGDRREGENARPEEWRHVVEAAVEERGRAQERFGSSRHQDRLQAEVVGDWLI